MSEIKRYNGIEEDVEGAFVYYDDYTRLQAELSAEQIKYAEFKDFAEEKVNLLKAERSELKQQLSAALEAKEKEGGGKEATWRRTCQSS